MDFHVAREFLESHATEEDFRLALDTLTRDRNGWNRIVAIGILARFPEREETWHALIRAARGFGPLDWGHSQAAVYGVPEEKLGEFYAQRTLLKREVLPEHVANAVFALTGGDLTHTTGLHVPVDAGVAAAFLR